MKKLLSVLLALSMVLSLGVMSFAADSALDDVKGTLEGVYNELKKITETDDFQAKFEDFKKGAGEIIDDPTKIQGMFDDLMREAADAIGVDWDAIKAQLESSEIFDIIGKLIEGSGKDETTTKAPEKEADKEEDQEDKKDKEDKEDGTTIVDTGSAAGSLAIFATLSIAAAAAFVCTKKN